MVPQSVTEMLRDQEPESEAQFETSEPGPDFGAPEEGPIEPQFLVSFDDLDAIVAYLVERPYREVADLMARVGRFEER